MYEIIEGSKRHPKLDGDMIQLLAVENGKVIAWAVHDNYQMALFLLKREIYNVHKEGQDHL